MEIVWNAGALKAVETAIQAASLTAMEALKGEVESAQVIPYDMGTMQGSAHVEQQAEGAALHTRLYVDGPQARRLYHHPEYNFQRGKNANAGGEWYAPWLAGGKNENYLRGALEAQLKEKMP